MKLVHFFFLDIGLGKIEDHPIYLKNIDILKRLNPNTKVNIWNENQLDMVVKNHYPHLLNFWNNFPSKFYKIDFGRYLILKKYGGMYLDLDMECIRPLPEENEMDFINIFLDKKGVETFNNNIIYFRNPDLYDELIDFAIYRFQTNKMPLMWKRRRFLYTVGARMYHKFCTNKKLEKTPVDTFFKDLETKSWLKVDV
tara:strand:- start:1159 stop:1749 length:591 start_codon:yes stop_codon:yes gene_type:complete